MANDLKTSIKIGIDVDDRAPLADAAADIEAIGEAVGNSAPKIEQLGDALDSVRAPEGLSDAADELQDLGRAAGEAQDGLDQLALDEMAEGIKKIGFEPLIAELERLAAQGGEMAPRLAKAAGELSALANSARAAQEPLERIKSAAERADEAMGRMGVRSADQIKADIQQIEQDLIALGNSATVSGRDFDSAFAGGQDKLASLREELERVPQAASAIPAALKPVAAALAGVFAAGKLKQYASEMIAVADQYGQMASRIELATNSQTEYEQVQARLLETAKKTYRPLAEAQELYIRTADALRAMANSTEDVLDITDSFSYLLVNNAASAEKAGTAITAYTKAIQAGKLDALGWQTILAAMPTVVDAIAESTGRAAAEVRQLGITGKLSVTELNEALRQTVDANRAVSESMPATVSDAITRLSTAWGAYIGEANRAKGATQLLVKMLESLAENLGEVAEVAAYAGATAVTAFAVKGLAALKIYIGGLVAATGATTGLAAATTAVAAAAARLAPLLAALGLVLLAKQTWDLVGAWRELRAEQQKQADLQDEIDAKKNDQAKKMAEISRETGVLVTSTKELIQAQKDGKIHSDELTHSWMAGPAPLRELAEQMGQTGKAIVDGFDAAIASGAELEDALKGVTEAFSLDSGIDLQGFSDALKALAADGKISAEQVQQAWAMALDALDPQQLVRFAEMMRSQALVTTAATADIAHAFDEVAVRIGKLSSEQMASFGAAAKLAFEAGAMSAEKFAQINDQVLSESFRRLGVNGAAAMGRISPATQEAIDNIDNVVQALRNTGMAAPQAQQALEMALRAAIVKADTLQGLDALNTKIKELKASGDVGEQAFGRLSAASADAAQKMQGAAQGTKVAADQTAMAGVSFERGADAMDSTGEAADKAADDIAELNSAAASSGSIAMVMAAKWETAKHAVREASEAAYHALASLSDGGRGFDGITGGIKAMHASAASLVQDDDLGALNRELAEMQGKADEAGAAMQHFAEHARHVGLGWSGLYDSLAAMHGLAQALWQAKVRLKEFDVEVQRFNDDVADGNVSLSAQEKLLQQLVHRAEQLGSQQLRGLRGALADVRQQMQDFRRDIEDTMGALQDEIDQMQGKYVDAERRRQSGRRRELELKLQTAREQGDHEGIRAVQATLQKLAELEALKVTEAREREREDKAQRDRDRSRDQKPERTPQQQPDDRGGRGDVHVHIGGVLDVNDRATLESLGRKMQPVFDDLHRRGALR